LTTRYDDRGEIFSAKVEAARSIQQFQHNAGLWQTNADKTALALRRTLKTFQHTRAYFDDFLEVFWKNNTKEMNNQYALFFSPHVLVFLHCIAKEEILANTNIRQTIRMARAEPFFSR